VKVSHASLNRNYLLFTLLGNERAIPRSIAYRHPFWANDAAGTLDDGTPVRHLTQ